MYKYIICESQVQKYFSFQSTESVPIHWENPRQRPACAVEKYKNVVQKTPAQCTAEESNHSTKKEHMRSQTNSLNLNYWVWSDSTQIRWQCQHWNSVQGHKRSLQFRSKMMGRGWMMLLSIKIQILIKSGSDIKSRLRQHRQHMDPDQKEGISCS